MIEIERFEIERLMKLELVLPDYQRPYKWTNKNMVELLNDLSDAVISAEKIENFRYRIGTVILHEISDEVPMRYEIVDGQQRILSLALIMLCLKKDFTCPLLEDTSFDSKITQKNLYLNYRVACEYLLDNEVLRGKLADALRESVEVVVISVKNVAEAFQLFDSQNTRGRALDPHDLLKAYHLREMREYPYEMRQAVMKWEAVKASDIRELFGDYLFPIKSWASGKKSHTFTARDIDCYKGISESSPYTYARRASHALPYFQLTAPFPAGGGFFDMVAHYLCLLSDIKAEMHTEKFKELKAVLDNKDYDSAGFNYAKKLFYCALLCYYDKFRNFDERAVRRLFTWAYMLRVDMEHLGFDSINKYAIGEGDRYSNKIGMFALIEEARLHSQIANIPMNIRKPDNAATQKREALYVALRNLNGVGGGENA